MNRRNFLNLIPKVIIGLTIAPKITSIFIEPVSIGPVGEFIAYIEFTVNFYVISPPLTCIIENIQIPDYENF